MSQRIKGILFDLGDTLLDFPHVDVTKMFAAGARLAYEYLRQIGQPLPPFHKYHRMQLWAIRQRYFLSRITRREFNALDLIARLGARMGQTLTRSHAVELAWLWYEPLSKRAVMEADLPTTLRQLRDRSLTLGLVSNTFIPAEALDRHLRRESLIDLLPVRVYSCNVGRRKPHQRIFDVALGEARLRPDQTLFVGDSPRADIKGANRAGMISVLKDPAQRHAKSRIKPHHRIARIAELIDIVAGYNRGGAD